MYLLIIDFIQAKTRLQRARLILRRKRVTVTSSHGLIAGLAQMAERSVQSHVLGLHQVLVGAGGLSSPVLRRPRQRLYLIDLILELAIVLRLDFVENGLLQVRRRELRVHLLVVF